MVTEGMCIHGCGRRVNPGRMKNGKRFKTCCAGCADGVHNLYCSVVIEEGKCTMGCGRDVAGGLMPSGRPFKTCCKLCAKTGGTRHDEACKGG